MALSTAQDNTIRRFKRIGESVRAKLERLHIKSSNKFWNLKREQTGDTLGDQRDIGYSSEEDCANIISVSRVGNCGEKGMAYGWWATQEALFQGGNDRVYTLTSDPYWDHMWAVICEVPLTVNNRYNFSNFGPTACMLDGWSEDFYFPNIGKLDAIRLNVWRCQNPFQVWVRAKANKLGNGKKSGWGPIPRIKVVSIVA